MSNFQEEYEKEYGKFDYTTTGSNITNESKIIQDGVKKEYTITRNKQYVGVFLIIVGIIAAIFGFWKGSVIATDIQIFNIRIGQLIAPAGLFLVLFGGVLVVASEMKIKIKKSDRNT